MRPVKQIADSVNQWLVRSILRPFAPAVTRARPDLRWHSVRSVLVVKLDEIGDFVLATAFLRELRRNAPQARIALVVKPVVHNLAATCPHVDQVLVYDWQVTGRHALLAVWRRHWRAFRFARARLKRSHFEAAVVPRYDADTYDAVPLAVHARPRRIIAYAESCTASKRAVNRGYDRLLTDIVPPAEKVRHEVESDLALIERFGGTRDSDSLELWLTSDDEAYARAHLDPVRRYVAVAPGASKPEKRWPAERFAQIAGWLESRHGLTPLVLGADFDPVLPGVASLLGRATLRQAAAVIRGCALFVGNDSGLKHIAAAVRTPVIEINACRVGADEWHPVNPSRFCAWQVPQRVVRPPAGAGALAIGEIPVSAVAAAADALLSEIPRIAPRP